MAVVIGCGVNGCGGHNTPEGAYQHARRSGLFDALFAPAPDPRDSDAAAREAVREDEAARDWTGAA